MVRFASLGRRVALALGLLVVCAPFAADAAWPPAPGSDPLDPANWPNDPGFASFIATGSGCADGAAPICNVNGSAQMTCVAGKWTETTACASGQVCQYVGSGAATVQQCAPGTGPKMYVTDGEWNNFSFIPEAWTRQPNFRQAERAIGTGMHTNDAWSTTIGDRRVIIAVIDCGIKWDSDDQVNKFYLNKGELLGKEPEAACRTAAYKGDAFDANGDGKFTMADYAKEDPLSVPRTSCDSRVSDLNGNGLLDPEDLIKSPAFADGKDTDGNGYVDDISGWDFYRNDNDPYDDTRYGHGTGEARDSSAEGNNGRGSLGICPECTTLMVRAGDSFVADGNDFAAGVLFATDSGASVIQSALGSLSRSLYAEQAIEYAYQNDVVFIASAADELSFHHNMPSTTNHALYVHAIVFDGPSDKNSTTFLNFNNCTNYGGNLLLSSPGTGCSSEATGVTSGHAGMIYSAALQASLTPPMTAEEVRGVLLNTVDDIDVPESLSDPTKFVSGPGWDLHFGYGRNNVANSVKMVAAKLIPPEADILLPTWFEPIEVTKTPKYKVTGRVGARADGLPSRYAKYTWVLEYAKGIDPKSGWTTIKDGTDAAAFAGDIAEWDVAAAAQAIDFTAPLADHDQYSFTLRLRVTAKTTDGVEVKNEFRKSIGLFKDPDLLPGFPIRNLASIEASGKMFDIDGDGKDEFILPNSDGRLHAFKADGTEPKGWPVFSPLRRELSEDFLYNITKACAFRTDKTGCLRKNGGVKPEFHEMCTGTPAIGDLDGDGKMEVVFTTYDGNVMVVEADGSTRPGFPVHVDRERMKKADETHLWDDGIFSAPSLGDMDGDKKLEIVVGAMDGQLYMWRHDGTMQKGFPIEVVDKTKPGQGDRIVTTPSIGDIDNDGTLDIALGTNEVFGADKAKNEARGYVLHGDGTLFKGYPVTTYGIQAYVLPSVGSGVPGNATLVDLDGDKKLEVNFDTIGSAGTFFTWDGKTYCIGKKAGACTSTFSNNAKNFGPKSNTKEKTAAFVLISDGSVGHVDPGGGIDFIKASAGFDFALTFASGGQRADFDHLIGAYDSATGKMLEGWPRVIDDWQFFSNPSIVDLDADKNPEVVAASAGYLIHAWNYLGAEPVGFPHYTMGWMLASPAVGDMDGDGKFDVAIGSRDGWIFAWGTRKGVIKDAINEWPMHGHDLHNTDNYHAPINPYAKKADTDAGSTDTTGGDDAITAVDTGDTATPTDSTAPAKSGCTASTGGGHGAGAVIGLVLLAALVLRRRLFA